MLSTLAVAVLTLGASPDRLSELVQQARNGHLSTVANITGIVSYASSTTPMLLAAKVVADQGKLLGTDRAVVGGNLFCVYGDLEAHRCAFKGRALGLDHIQDLAYVLRAEIPFMFKGSSVSRLPPGTHSVQWFVLMEDAVNQTLYLGGYIAHVPDSVPRAALPAYFNSPELDLGNVLLLFESTIGIRTQHERNEAAAVVEEIAFRKSAWMTGIPPLQQSVITEWATVLEQAQQTHVTRSGNGTTSILTMLPEPFTVTEKGFLSSPVYTGAAIGEFQPRQQLQIRCFATPRDTLIFTNTFASTVLGPKHNKQVYLATDPVSQTAAAIVYDVDQSYQATVTPHSSDAIREDLRPLAFLRFPIGTDEEQRIAARIVHILQTGEEEADSWFKQHAPAQLYSADLGALQYLNFPSQKQALSVSAQQPNQNRGSDKDGLLWVVLFAVVALLAGIVHDHSKRQARRAKAKSLEAPAQQGITKVEVVYVTPEQQRALAAEVEAERQRRLQERREREALEKQTLANNQANLRKEPTREELEAKRRELIAQLQAMLNATNPPCPAEMVTLIKEQMDKANAEPRLSRQIKFLEYPLIKQ